MIKMSGVQLSHQYNTLIGDINLTLSFDEKIAK